MWSGFWGWVRFFYFDVDETTKVYRSFLPIIRDVNYTPSMLFFAEKQHTIYFLLLIFTHNENIIFFALIIAKN